MNIEESAFKDRKTLAKLNTIDLLDIIEFLQLDRKQWINQFSKTHNESIDIQKENQELKKHLKVPKACNLKTLEDYKSYYEDTTREQILEDTYIEYCAYVNLAHRYSELKKQVEEYQKDIKDLDNQNKRAFENMQLNQLKVCNMIKQQKEFIKYLKGKINFYKINTQGYSMNLVEEILQKYKEIIGVKDGK